jgi:signal transduction histidine kinase
VRIARELHDLVAHQITLANAQATVAAHLFDTRPEQTRKSLNELVETTGDALDDLRATVGLLRQSGDAPAPAEPAPGLSRLPTLLESFRRAGLEVSVHQEGTARPLPPGVDLTAYRIVQEALTNVTKHAGTGSARVHLVWNRDRVTITVADDGRDARTPPTPSTKPSASTAPDRPPGYGLIGMRERAAAVGGDLSAGKRPEGGFLVSTQLPLPPAKDSTRRTDAVTTTIEGRTPDGAVHDGRTGDGEAGDTP